MPFRKIFDSIRRKRRDAPVATIELTVDATIYERLKNRALKDGVSENEELLQALRRGMSDYWLHVATYEREQYKLIAKLFEQSKRDNELLESLISQNLRFLDMLEHKESKEKSSKKQ
jgi:hypothetical protein